MRAAEPKDVPAIRAVAEASWGVAYKSILSVDQMDYMLDWMYSEALLRSAILSGEQVFLLEEENDAIVGFVAFSFPPTLEGICKLHKLYLLPEMQGKGVGKRLIEEVKGRAAENGKGEIQLNVNKKNSAFHFYLRAGFEIIKEEVVDIGNGYVMDDYVMAYKKT